MLWFWRFLENLRPPVPFAELAAEFRLILIASAKDPIGAALVESSGMTPEVYADAVCSRFENTLSDISKRQTRKVQAQRLREVLLNVHESYAADDYVSFKAHELIRDVYLAATYNTESESELRPLAAAAVKRAVEGMILSVSFRVLYVLYYDKFMPEEFLYLHQKMCEYAVRLQCVKHFATVLPMMDREKFEDYRELSEIIISQARQDEIEGLAKDYRSAIVSGNFRQVAAVSEECAELVQLIDSESNQFFRLLEAREHLSNSP